ncbi:hypothetical protein V8C35DRAFT_309653 [Trichoderma chlorosporum]
MLKLVKYSIRQQIDPKSTPSESHLITSIALPQRETSFLIEMGALEPCVSAIRAAKALQMRRTKDSTKSRICCYW